MLLGIKISFLDWTKVPMLKDRLPDFAEPISSEPNF